MFNLLDAVEKSKESVTESVCRSFGKAKAKCTTPIFSDYHILIKRSIKSQSTDKSLSMLHHKVV